MEGLTATDERRYALSVLNKAVVGVFDDRRFTLHFAHAVDEPIALDLELLLS